MSILDVNNRLDGARKGTYHYRWSRRATTAFLIQHSRAVQRPAHGLPKTLVRAEDKEMLSMYEQNASFMYNMVVGVCRCCSWAAGVCVNQSRSMLMIGRRRYAERLHWFRFEELKADSTNSGYWPV